MTNKKTLPGALDNFSDNGARGATDTNHRRVHPYNTAVFKHPKTELEAAIQRYVDLFEFAPIPYVSFDRVGRIEEINLAAAQLLGGSRTRLIGGPFALHVTREDAGIFLNHLLHCRSSGTRVETELHLKKRNGDVVLVHLASWPATSLMRDGALLYQTAILDLTEQKQAEEAIRQSELRFRTLFDLVPVAVYACDAQGVIQEFNQRAVELWGREPLRNNRKEKFCGSCKIFYPDGRPMPHSKCPMARALRGEQLSSADLEIIVERPDGERRHIIPAPKILRNGAGEIIGAINCLYDITERKRIEKALAEEARGQEILYRFVQQRGAAKSISAVFSAALDTIIELLRCDRAAILLLDDGNAMRFAAQRRLSRRYCRAVEGHSPWKTDVKNPKPICIPDTRDADLPRKIKSALRKEGIKATAFIPLVIENRLIGKFMMYYDSPHVFSEEEVNLALNAAGKLALGIERKQAEAALYESEERMRAMVEQATVGMARADQDGRLVVVNKPFCEMLGYKESELIGKSISAFTYKDETAQTAALFRRLIRHGQPYELEKRYIRKDGSVLWVNVSASPVRDPHGRPRSAVSVVVDITKRKQAEAALKRSRAQLEDLVQQRTQALREANLELQSEIQRRKGLEGEILSISDREQQRLGQELHDGLCQQLAAIGLMMRATTLRLKDHRVVQVEDLENLTRLINDAVISTRHISRDLHRDEIDAAGFNRALRDLAERKIWTTPCRLELKTNVQLSDDKVASQLYRILREAVVNANKHSKATQVILEVAQSDGDVVFSVTDNGTGLGNKSRRGMGLGLHIMKHRAQSIGASLEFESPRGGGARVVCRLPQSR